MQTIQITEQTLEQLQQAAAIHGVDPDRYADRLLATSLAALQTILPGTKPYRILEFAGVAPTGRSAQEIDALIEADRAAWDKAQTEFVDKAQTEFGDDSPHKSKAT